MREKKLIPYLAYERKVQIWMDMIMGLAMKMTASFFGSAGIDKDRNKPVPIHKQYPHSGSKSLPNLALWNKLSLPIFAVHKHYVEQIIYNSDDRMKVAATSGCCVISLSIKYKINIATHQGKLAGPLSAARQKSLNGF